MSYSVGTGGIPASFDAMLMITTDGGVRDTRIVPNKNDLAKECYDAVRCVQDVFATVTVQGLTRFQGARQAYMTVTLLTPDDRSPIISRFFSGGGGSTTAVFCTLPSAP